MLKHLFFICLLSTSLWQCSNSSDDACRYGKPKPIFSDEMAGVVSHSFLQEGQEGNEQIRLQSGLEVEIYQTGCDAIKQEFRFTLQDLPPTQPDAFWISAAAACFIELSTLEADPIIFSQYAQAIQQYAPNFILGEQAELATGFYMMIDGIKMGGEGLLRVVFQSTKE
ncbi:MAG: hypothetical protein KDC34_12905 [Saprospiraceae bacterium]|nr:hypothetical protein [Saprospiraceae bacterium]